MDLTPHVEELRHQLLVATETGTDEVRTAAERLVVGLDPAARLAMLDVLTAAAAEITQDLAPGSVEVRLRGRDAELVVTPAPVLTPSPPLTPSVTSPTAPGPPAVTPDGEEGATARITLRMPDALKARVEAAAATDGLSVNAWLVRAVGAAVGSPAGATAAAPVTPTATTNHGGQRLTGWAR